MNLLKRLYLAWMDRTDSAWAPTGIKQLHSGYDQTKAGQSIERANQQEKRQRSNAIARAGQLKPIRGLSKADTVTPFDRKQA